MTRNVTFAPLEFYHLYNRGNDKRIVFTDNHDYERFLLLLFLCNDRKAVDVRSILNTYEGSTFVDVWTAHERDETLVDIGAYCLMLNHFHIFLQEKIELGIALFMQKLTTAYTMYFNKRHNRTGSLFQGRFKARHVDAEEYFNWLFSYIHLNPVKLVDPLWKERGIINRNTAGKFMEKYKYSSYHDYFIKKRPESSILSMDVFPDYFKEMNDFKSLTDQWNEEVKDGSSF